MKIILGAGHTQYAGWTATQENELDIRKDDYWAGPLPAGQYRRPAGRACMGAYDLGRGAGGRTELLYVSKARGYIRCAVPDGNFRNEWYQEMIQVGGPGPADHPAFTHRIVYDYRTFVSVFEQAGFVVSLLEYCDANGVFHYTYWNKGDGMIGRSYLLDTRNTGDQLGMVSIIIDAKKPLIISANGE